MTLLSLLRLDPAPQPHAACAQCVFFDSRAATIERQFPGLSSLSSGYASVRDGDGLCTKHLRLLRATSGCAEFARK
jgi:hypothetical protein